MIWLVGHRGLLGAEVGRTLTRAGLMWVGTGREVDVTDPRAVASMGERHPVTVVINCSGYTAVDQAESEPDLCRRVNVGGPTNLALWCQAHEVLLIHVSSDYVFSGEIKEPYTEDSRPQPLGVYGASKAEGDSAVASLCSRHYIFRTSWLYGTGGSNFVTTMLGLMNQREILGVVADQWGSPTWTSDLATLMVALAGQPRAPWGIYHASGEGYCSWYEFARAIFDEGRVRGLVPPDRSLRLEPLTSLEYPARARRPAWSVLSSHRLRSVVGVSFPPWRTSLQRFLDQVCSTEPHPVL